MATIYSPTIVSNGLVMCFDAANRKSYTSGSSIIQDLSGNNMYAGTSGTLLYTGSYGGGFRFQTATPGQLSAHSSSISIGSSGCTMAVWLMHETILTSAGYMRYVSVQDNSPPADDLIIRHVYSLSSTSPLGSLEMVVKTSGTFKTFQVHNQVQANVPVYIVTTWNGTTMTIYKNGLSVGTNTPGGTYAATTKQVTVSSNSTETMNGQIYSTMVYNRALSQQEIQQNFDANRKRFGI